MRQRKRETICLGETDRQTYRQTDRQTDRQRKRETICLGESASLILVSNPTSPPVKQSAWLAHNLSATDVFKGVASRTLKCVDTHTREEILKSLPRNAP